MTQQKRSDFTQVPNILLDAYDELSETSLVGYLRLIRKYGHKGCFIGSIRKLCKELRMSRMTVYRMIPVWIGSGLAQKGVQPKEDENRDEMIIIISLEALWQQNTEYYAKRPNLGQSEDTSVPIWDKDVPDWDSSVPKRDNGVPNWDDFVPTASTKQGGNTSNTNSNTDNTEKEREVATATARSQTSSQNDLSDDEDTVKKEAVHGHTHQHPTMDRDLPAHGDLPDPVQSQHRKEDTNKVVSPRKPPVNKPTIPKHITQQGLMDTKPEPELPPSPSSKPVEPLAEMAWGTRKCLQWFDYWRGGTLIAKYKLQQAASFAKGLAEQFDEKTVVEVYGDMAADQYYIERGGPDIGDVANNIHKYINKKKPKKEPSNEHKTSSFYSAQSVIERNKWKMEAFQAEYEAKIAMQEAQS